MSSYRSLSPSFQRVCLDGQQENWKSAVANFHLEPSPITAQEICNASQGVGMAFHRDFIEGGGRDVQLSEVGEQLKGEMIQILEKWDEIEPVSEKLDHYRDNLVVRLSLLKALLEEGVEGANREVYRYLGVEPD